MTVSVDQVRPSLLTLDDVEKVLSSTEPLGQRKIAEDSRIHFDFEDDWNEGLDQVRGVDVVNVVMRIDGEDHPMTKDAAIMAASNVGLTGNYVRKTPGRLISPQLNYWYGTDGVAYNVLSIGNDIAAFTRPTVVPFSNLSLLESVVSGIHRMYGADTEILADWKINNTLGQTDVRLILPEHTHTISSSGMSDIPFGEEDVWLAGVHLSNSLIGRRQTAVESYLFRYWCTNGATSTLGDVGTWSRRSNGQEADVYLWAQEAVDEVLGGMEDKFDEVQALTSLNVDGKTADVMREIFKQYAVPVSQREKIMEFLLEAEHLNMYTIMNAITSAANISGLSPERADRLMRIGGSVPTASFDTLKARIWDEGHTAESTKRNPYCIVSDLG